MALTCTKCHRVNPAAAIYCYFDGSVLPGHGKNGGPLNAGVMPFTSPFVFPSGRRCKNFDELSLGCLQEWPQAVDLLQQGFFESFLGGNGRADLAQVARQAAKFPDRDRGLDMLIERLPSHVVAPPKLFAEPLDINLGQLNRSQDRRFDLHIRNQGMRLLYGSITVEKGVWLAIGDAPGVSEKGFQTDHEVVIPILIRGNKLKASSKVQEGKLVIESNGGAADVTVRYLLPTKPFPDGILAGAKGQREMAERAFANAKESAALFESGVVAKWYADNGWEYPIRGPAAAGLAALQQFFEVCGLTRPPKLEIDTAAIYWDATTGAKLEHKIRVKADKKPAYAFGSSDQPWLVVHPTAFSGTVATVPIEIPVPPESADGTATAKLTIVSNGRQKFFLPVTVKVPPSLRFAPAPFAEAPSFPTAPAPATDPALDFFGDQGGDDDEGGPPLLMVPRRSAPMTHATPAVLLLFALLGVFLYDWLKSPVATDHTSPETAAARVIQINFTEPKHKDRNWPPFRFGISLQGGKKLTYSSGGMPVNGLTNNTCVRVDGRDLIFGTEGKATMPRPGRGPEFVEWEFPGTEIVVTQDVSYWRGQSGKLDTCLVRYKIENRGGAPRKVGLRFLLDTFIGNNDGVPFTIPPETEPMDTMRIFGSALPGDPVPAVEQVPDYIQALEGNTLKSVGTVAHLTLRVPEGERKFEEPVRVQLAHWPFYHENLLTIDKKALWTIPVYPIKYLDPTLKAVRPDSAVVIYWAEKEMQSGEIREMAFAYGLGQVTASGRLGLTAGGSLQQGKEFAVTAYIEAPEEGQTVKLNAPGELEVVGQSTQLVPVGGRGRAQVNWRVKALRSGPFTMTAELRAGDKVLAKTDFKGRITPPRTIFE